MGHSPSDVFKVRLKTIRFIIIDIVMLKKISLFVSKHRLFLGIFAYCVFCWVWLLEIDLAELATSAFAGKIMQMLTVLALTFLSTAIYTKSLKVLFAHLNKTKRWLVPMKLIAWWAATECIVAWAVSFIWYGTGARLDNILPFTSISHFAIWTPLGYLTRFVGIYGLSGVICMLLVLGLRHDFRRLFIPVFSVVMVLNILAWGMYQTPNGPKVSVMVVSNLSAKDDFSGPMMPKDDSLVVLPEYGFNDIESHEARELFGSRSMDKKVYFIGSRFVYEPGRVKNQLVAGDTKNGYTYQVDKSRLIPMGEYVPYVTVGLFKVIGAQYVLDYFKSERQITKAEGTPQEMLLQLGVSRVGAGVCSSIIAPEDYRTLAKHGANILTNSAFLGIFSGSKIYSWHQRSMAKLMATANARTFLQAATSGTSFGYDNNGKILFNEVGKGVSELSVLLNNRRTPYTILGEYLSFGGIVWMLSTFIKSKKKR